MKNSSSFSFFRISLTLILLLILFSSSTASTGGHILIPMDDGQRNHLKAYGLIYQHLLDGYQGKWLLNYRGGSFMAPYHENLVRNSRVRGVSIETISSGQAARIVEEVERPNVNMAVVELEKAPSIAVYAPDHTLPWDDAVTLALTYAEVPYDVIYNEEILDGVLEEYDWLHLHHEDFTGQHGKFWFAYRNQPWYIRQVRDLENMASELGFEKVSEMKLAVVWTIRDFIEEGGFLFAMCSGADTFDIALAATEVDIVPMEFDGDPADPNANEKLDFSHTLAFKDFEVTLDPAEYRHANIDIPDYQTRLAEVDEEMDYFTLFNFSAKWDPVPTMLTQNHVSSIKGFYGQSTAFRKETIKSNVVIMAEAPGRNEVKYLHGNLGEGFFTFYGGHDPEDYTHRVGDPPTELDLFPNSPGYRLILNNILFPAAQKQEMQTFRGNEKEDLIRMLDAYAESLLNSGK
ncbi:asparagine synthetase B [Balneolaceae bacterium ANBcel3]|nr:asparagine synthetase B [Balneolaceae bacterium ANBcel3]